MVYLSWTGITGNSSRYDACAVVSSMIFFIGLPVQKKQVLSSVSVEKNAKRRTSNQEVLCVPSLSQLDFSGKRIVISDKYKQTWNEIHPRVSYNWK